MKQSVTDTRLPLFPLHTVLFPGCELPLQIFEQRYIRLVKESLRDNTGFIVTLIQNGDEVGSQPELFTIGNYVTISDWETLDNGLLGIAITSHRRVRIDQPNAQHDGLLTAAVYELPEQEPSDEIISEYSDLTDTLKQLHEHSLHQNLNIDYEDSTDIINKLSYLLPISNLNKQTLLEIDNIHDHSAILRSVILQLQASGHTRE